MATQLLISPTRPGTVSITDTSTTVTGTGTNFNSSDVGKEIIIRTSEGDKVRVISSYTSATVVNVSVALDITESGCYFTYDLFELDLYDNFPYSFNYNIADIREPEKRNSSYSKTIQIPGTKGNNIVLSHIFEIDGDGGFNPNLRAEALILSDTIQVLRGNFQLLKINRLGDRIDYEIAVFGKTGNLFMQIGDKTLQDLDWTGLGHISNKTNQVATWTAPVGTGYVYPLIDNGLDAVNGFSVFRAENMVMSIYAKTILDYIFTASGYTYNSAFFNTDFFKRLIIPCLKRDRADVTINYRFDIDTGGGGGSTDMTLQLMRWNSETGLTEVLDGPYTVGVTGSGGGNDTFDFSTDVTLNSNDRVWLEYGMTTLAISIHDDTHIEIIYNDPNADLIFDGSFYAKPNYVSSGTSMTGVSGPFPSTMVHLRLIDDGPVLPGYDPNNTWDVSTSVHTVPVGTVASKVPPNVKQKDFLISLIRMFNLYIEPDPFLHNVLNIEPRDDYYSGGVVRDWTYKLDTSNEIEITPMGELDWKEYLFTYAKDNDYYNTLYNDEFKEVYGQQDISVDNDFLTQKKDVKLVFASTPSVADSQATLILPTIVSEGTGIVPDDYPEAIIRILYYGGMKTGYWRHTEYSTGTTTHLTYPYAGHLDDPQNPTLDILWGQPEKIYWTMTDPTLYTANGLYNTYWSNFIGEVSDKSSKIVTANFNLSAKDIYNLDFRDTYFIDGHYLRLNKIYDYNPDVPSTTKCEFIKISEAVAVASSSVVLTHGSGGSQRGQLRGTSAVIGDANITTSRATVAIGQGNIVIGDSEGAIVSGVRSSVISSENQTDFHAVSSSRASGVLSTATAGSVAEGYLTVAGGIEVAHDDILYRLDDITPDSPLPERLMLFGDYTAELSLLVDGKTRLKYSGSSIETRTAEVEVLSYSFSPPSTEVVITRVNADSLAFFGSPEQSDVSISIFLPGVGEGSPTSRKGYFSRAEGYSSHATGDFSRASGAGGLTTLYGQQAHGAMRLVPGDSQHSVVVLSGQTLSGTSDVLYLQGGGAQLAELRDNRAYFFNCMVVGRGETHGQAAGYRIEGLATRGYGAATTTINFSSSADYEDDNTWDATVVADTANGSLNVYVTNASGETVDWTARLEWVEVG